MRAATATLDSRLATEADPAAKQDLEILIAAAAEDIEGTELAVRTTVPFFSVASTSADFLASGVELVVLDLDYKGKDAWDLVESLLETHPLTPIVFLTSARASAEWGLVTAVAEMLEKPLPAARLVAAVRRLLAEGTTQRFNRNSRQRMARRYSRPYVGSPSTDPAYSGWDINE